MEPLFATQVRATLDRTIPWNSAHIRPSDPKSRIVRLSGRGWSLVDKGDRIEANFGGLFLTYSNWCDALAAVPRNRRD